MSTAIVSNPEDDILTVEDAAKLLQVSPNLLTVEARFGRIPHCRIGRKIRFVRSELLAWARRGSKREGTGQ